MTPRLKTLELIRGRYTSTGTYGMLCEQFKAPFCVTYELPWLENQRNISCIPEGKYLCIAGLNSRKKHVFHVRNVLNRTNIQIHTGNTADDVQGCILVGEQFEWLNDKRAVLSSRKAFEELQSIVWDKPFWLEISS